MRLGVGPYGDPNRRDVKAENTANDGSSSCSCGDTRISQPTARLGEIGFGIDTERVRVNNPDTDRQTDAKRAQLLEPLDAFERARRRGDVALKSLSSPDQWSACRLAN